MKFYLTIAIGLFAALPALASEQESFTSLRATPPTCAQGDSSCVIMTENEKFDLAEFGALDFIGIPEDSRCPIDAVCFWEGRVRVELKHEGQEASEKFEVGLGGDLKPRWIDPRTGLVLRLEQVWPEKQVSIPTQEPYRIKLRVESADAPAQPSEGSNHQIEQDSAAQQNQDSPAVDLPVQQDQNSSAQQAVSDESAQSGESTIQ